MGSYHKRMVALCLWMILLLRHLGSYASTAIVQRPLEDFAVPVLRFLLTRVHVKSFQTWTVSVATFSTCIES